MPPSLTDLWPLLQAVRGAAGAAMRKAHPEPPPAQQISEEFDLKQSAQYVGSFIYMLENYNGEALSTAHYRARNCYDNPQVIDRQLESLAADGILEAADGAIYRATGKGRHLYARAKTLLRPRWTLPLAADAEIEQINALLLRLAEATFAAPEPPPHWAATTRARYGVTRPPDLLPLERLSWHTFDLWSYRDDAHLAAWSDYDVTPHAWEALTYLWNGVCDSAQKLADYHEYREFTPQDWAAFAGELTARGWVESAGDSVYRLTAEGQSVRDAAERRTDDIFYGPWAALSAAEIEHLRGHLTRLRDRLQEFAAG